MAVIHLRWIIKSRNIWWNFVLFLIMKMLEANYVADKLLDRRWLPSPKDIESTRLSDNALRHLNMCYYTLALPTIETGTQQGYFVVARRTLHWQKSTTHFKVSFTNLLIIVSILTYSTFIGLRLEKATVLIYYNRY